jgi:transcriptional regulator of met regulon
MVKKWNGNFINPYIEHGEKRDKGQKSNCLNPI